jgi:hypothetical protein
MLRAEQERGEEGIGCGLERGCDLERDRADGAGIDKKHHRSSKVIYV